MHPGQKTKAQRDRQLQVIAVCLRSLWSWSQAWPQTMSLVAWKTPLCKSNAQDTQLPLSLARAVTQGRECASSGGQIPPKEQRIAQEKGYSLTALLILSRRRKTQLGAEVSNTSLTPIHPCFPTGRSISGGDTLQQTEDKSIQLR